MTCEDAQALLHAFLDSEFDPDERRDFEAHLQECESCRGRVEFESWFRSGLRKSFPAPTTPAALKARIRNDVRKTRLPPTGLPPLWAAAPAALAIAALATLMVLAWDSFQTPPPPMVDAVQMHRQGLPSEVDSSDPDAVRRWFWGKVNFPVQPPTAAATSALPARFLGARVSHVGRFPAAHMMYDVDGARVSVMAFRGANGPLPAAGGQQFGPRTVHFDRMDGYNVAFSRAGDITYAVTGDVAPARMVRFLPAAPP